MQKKKNNGKSGFTLVEMLVSIALIAIVFLLATRIFAMMNKSVSVGKSQADLGEQTRYMSEVVNNAVRFSDTVYTIPENSFVDSKLTRGWSYVGLKNNAKIPAGITQSGRELTTQALVDITYLGETPPTDLQIESDERIITNDDGCFLEKIVAFSEFNPETATELRYTLRFTPPDPTTTDLAVGALRYQFYATVYDKDGNQVEESRAINIDTVINGINNRQVAYRGSDDNPAVALAYHDATYVNTGMKGANVVFVSAVSHSMYIDGTALVNMNGNKVTRGYALQESANLFFNELVSDGVNITLVGFANVAYNAGTFKGSQTEEIMKVFIDDWSLKEPAKLDQMPIHYRLGISNNFGDGMRAGYFELKELAEKHPQYKNYLIVFSDGFSSIYSVNGSGDLLWAPGYITDYNSVNYGRDSIMFAEKAYDDPIFQLLPAAEKAKWYAYKDDASNYSSTVARNIAMDKDLAANVYAINLGGEMHESVLMDVTVANFMGEPYRPPSHAITGFESAYPLLPHKWPDGGGDGAPTTRYAVRDGDSLKVAFAQIAEEIAKDQWLLDGPKL